MERFLFGLALAATAALGAGCSESQTSPASSLGRGKPQIAITAPSSASGTVPVGYTVTPPSDQWLAQLDPGGATVSCRLDGDGVSLSESAFIPQSDLSTTGSKGTITFTLPAGAAGEATVSCTVTASHSTASARSGSSNTATVKFRCTTDTGAVQGTVHRAAFVSGPDDPCGPPIVTATPTPTPTPTPTATPAREKTWAGVWDSDFGRLTMDAGGSGSYEGFNPGTISGGVSGDVNEGTWSQPGESPRSGTYKFTLSSDGRSFTGEWFYDSGGCTACGWNGSCVSGPCLQNSIAGAAPTVIPRRD